MVDPDGESVTNKVNNLMMEAQKAWRTGVSTTLSGLLGEGHGTVRFSGDEIRRILRNASDLPMVLRLLRDHQGTQLEVLSDLAAVDWLDRRENRFEVVYSLLSLALSTRVRVVVSVAESVSERPSVTEIHPSAGWYEREAYDLYGLVFQGHSDLRRLLTDYGFVGHPMRKDFPLTGFHEVRYDEAEGRVVIEPVETAQDFREYYVESKPARS